MSITRLSACDLVKFPLNGVKIFCCNWFSTSSRLDLKVMNFHQMTCFEQGRKSDFISGCVITDDCLISDAQMKMVKESIPIKWMVFSLLLLFSSPRYKQLTGELETKRLQIAITI